MVSLLSTDALTLAAAGGALRSGWGAWAATSLAGAVVSGWGGSAAPSPLPSEAVTGVSGGDASAETGIGVWGGEEAAMGEEEEEEEERWEEGEEKKGRAEGAGLKRRKREERRRKRETETTMGRLRSERKDRAEKIAISASGTVMGNGSYGNGAERRERSRRPAAAAAVAGEGGVRCGRVGNARCRWGVWFQ